MMDKIEAMKVRLRNDFRLKEGTDYAILHKYDNTFILCIDVYKERLEQVAAEHGVIVSEWHYVEMF